MASTPCWMSGLQRHPRANARGLGTEFEKGRDEATRGVGAAASWRLRPIVTCRWFRRKAQPEFHSQRVFPPSTQRQATERPKGAPRP